MTGLPLRRTGKLEGHWELDVAGYPHPIQLSGVVRRAPATDETETENEYAPAPSEYEVCSTGRAERAG